MTVPIGMESLIIESPGTDSITVTTDIGPAGDRGTYVWSAASHPDQQTSYAADYAYLFGVTTNAVAVNDLFLNETNNRIYRWQPQPGATPIPYAWQEMSSGANVETLGSTTIDFNGAPFQIYNVSGPSTFSITNPSPGGYVKLILTATSGGPYTLAWSGSLKWTSGAAPTAIYNNKIIEVVFTSTTTADSGVYASWHTAEYDGKAFYTTPNVNSGQALVPAQHLLISGADLTLSNNNSAQSLFAAANDTITVAASTAYYFECEFHQTGTGTTSHTLNFGLGGTATTHDIQYQSYVSQNATGSATPTTTANYAAYIATAASTAITAATATAIYRSVRIRGTIRVNASGTLIPQVTFSTAPGVAPVIKRGAMFKLIPVGTAASNTANVIGAWS